MDRGDGLATTGTAHDDMRPALPELFTTHAFQPAEHLPARTVYCLDRLLTRQFGQGRDDMLGLTPAGGSVISSRRWRLAAEALTAGIPLRDQDSR